MIKYFTLEYWIDEGWYVGKLKGVPGVFSQGETLEELEENIRDAYKLMTEDEEISVPSSEAQTKRIGVKV
jgi:predicted RNase H-like HicB family nuclease